jgi:hypothetical protein
VRAGTANRSAEITHFWESRRLNQYISEQALRLWDCPNVSLAAHTLLFQFFIKSLLGFFGGTTLERSMFNVRHKGVKNSDFNDATPGFSDPGFSLSLYAKPPTGYSD